MVCLFCSFLIVSERLPLSQLFQVLLSLPSITPEGLGAFEVALSQTASAKEQRQQMKSFLLAAGGDQLKALKPQKNTSIITNVSSMSFTCSFFSVTVVHCVLSKTGDA